MKKKLVILGISAAVLLAAALLFAGIWKVNEKINSLHDTVVQMQEESRKEQELTAENGRCGYIPELRPEKEGWMITQFGDVMQESELCYTITTETGLVIVDGGWDYEVPRLRRIIAQYGNSVEAWILTHPHSDHITAFMEIYKDPQGIEIHHVYTVELPDSEILKENASWDEYWLWDDLKDLNVSGLEYLYKGDKRNILGLELEVLSAYNDKIDELSNDLMNDGSMMFRIKGKKESMLFCADVGGAGKGNKNKKKSRRLSKYLIKEYGDYLKSDYVQMAHHGFQGLDAEFYETVDPKAAFFDAPYWLMNGENTLSAKENEDLMLDMGKVVFSYYTAPNQIILE